MGFTSKVTSENTLPQLIAKLKSLDGYEAAAGFDGRLHPESGDPLYRVAMANEFGIGITERSFMTDSFAITKANQRRLVSVIQNVVYKKAKPREELRDLAEDMAQTIRDIIDEGNFEVTNNPTPLINTSFMRENVLGEVIKKDK